MEVRVFRKSAAGVFFEILPAIIFTLAIAAVVVLGLWQTEVSSRAEGRRLLEESIKNAVVRHYAVEGSYPVDISLVEEDYGIYIDRTRYAVFYRVWGSNVMPDVEVTELR